METLKGDIFAHEELQNLLIRVVDLVNIDGPLLTLYLHANKHLRNYRLYGTAHVMAHVRGTFKVPRTLNRLPMTFL